MPAACRHLSRSRVRAHSLTSLITTPPTPTPLATLLTLNVMTPLTSRILFWRANGVGAKNKKDLSRTCHGPVTDLSLVRHREMDNRPVRVRASTSAKDFWCRVRDSAEVSHDGNVKRNDAAFDPALVASLPSISRQQ